MTQLANRTCLPQTTSALSEAQVDAYLEDLHAWHLDNGKLCQRFSFTSYPETLAFAAAVGWIAHREDHHPDMLITYNHCEVRYSTHSVNGLSENDFICAAKIDAMHEN